MLKCSGRGHDPSGVVGTSEGQCAVLCPACLQPSKNLPDNWQDASKAKSWLYGLFLVINANFCLKRCAVSSDETDPSLSRGWAYFVEEKSYKSYILDRAEDVQEAHFLTLSMGVGTVDCTCHNMKHPNGISDLQKGEKTIRFFVPKFHLPAHVSKCQTIFSFNFTHFVGRTDGEAPERGCCQDTLDDHFGDWNWKKVVGLGEF
ncbi:hypothetical protein EDD22DRAFT_981037 [Suillus occidentalis]|nr:hypothetical protein EDD22DRAFT_981037 [Suillus occidentalis]